MSYFEFILITICLVIIWYSGRYYEKGLQKWFDKEYQKRRKEEQYIKDNTRFED